MTDYAKEREKAARDLKGIILEYRPYIVGLDIMVVDAEKHAQITVTAEGFPKVTTRMERRTCCAAHSYASAVNGFFNVLEKLRKAGYIEPY